jgi:DNA helicase HerA-like ATPase
MANPLVIAKAGDIELQLLPALANRHGLITGATGTGKTVTLQTMAEQFARIGVPVFMADVKGDLSGMAVAGGNNTRVIERARELRIELLHEPCHVVFWDVFGSDGHHVRATVSDLGPLLLARMLELNDIQEGVLTLTFKAADDAGLLLLDTKDLRAMLQHVGDHAAKLTTEYGNVSAASVGAIQRALLALEGQGADHFFGEPMLNVADLIQTEGGRGVVNILGAERLLRSPKLYGVVLLWLLAELFEQLPEIGDPEKPRLVFFFDEAHLLFENAPKALLDKIEQVVRLVRSKGVGVYFVTQNPLDIPDSVLAQLGNRVQHALRAFTPRDQKAVRAVAQTMRPNPSLSIEQAISELAVGEALVSLLDSQGRPGVTERALIVPPGSRVGPLTAEERAHVVASSPLAATYDENIDRESAFEKLRARVDGSEGATVERTTTSQSRDLLSEILFGRQGPRGGRQSEGLIEAMAKSVARAAGSQAGRSVMRGILGSLRGGRR